MNMNISFIALWCSNPVSNLWIHMHIVFRPNIYSYANTRIKSWSKYSSCGEKNVFFLINRFSILIFLKWAKNVLFSLKWMKLLSCINLCSNFLGKCKVRRKFVVGFWPGYPSVRIRTTKEIGSGSDVRIGSEHGTFMVTW